MMTLVTGIIISPILAIYHRKARHILPRLPPRLRTPLSGQYARLLCTNYLEQWFRGIYPISPEKRIRQKKGRSEDQPFS